MACPDIPPVSSAPPSATQPAASGGSVKPVIAEVTVEKAPTELYNQQQKVHIEGKVAANNAAANELRVTTASGEIVVKSATPMPPNITVGTDVALDLYMQKGQLVANIHALRPQATPATPTADTAPTSVTAPAPAPMPPMQTGATVTAILIPKDGGALPGMPALPSLSQGQLTAIFTQLQGSGFTGMPSPPSGMTALLAQPDALTAFNTLPAAGQQEILSYLGKPELQGVLKGILAQQASPGDAPDTNLLQIVRAQLSARVTHDAMQGTGGTTVPGTNPAMTLVRSLLPMIEAMPGQSQAFMAGSGKAHFAQQAANNLAAQLPQNIHEMKIGGIFTPGTTAPAVPASMTGTIESITSKGFPVLQTERGFFIVKASTDAPVGSTVVFTAKPMLPEDIIAPPGAARARESLHTLLNGWPALQDALTEVALLSPDIAASMRNTIPVPDATKMPPAVLFFLAALRTGTVENWLGPNALDILRQAGKKDLIERLGGDFARLSGKALSESVGEWRAFSIPMQNEDQLTQIQMFVRQQQDPETGKDEEQDAAIKPMTRFVVNVHLSRMGDVQLDGLMHKKRLELILRSNDMLPQTARQEILQRFTSGLEQTGMQGGITFHTRAQSWVTLTPPDQEEFTA